MIFQIDIKDEALEELEDIEAELRKDPLTATMTKEHWLSNYVIGLLNERVRNAYKLMIQTADIEELKTKMGSFKAVKIKNKIKKGAK